MAQMLPLDVEEATAVIALCGAKLPNQDRTCRNVAGLRTDHHGEGRCYKHGGKGGRPILHGRYSQREIIPLADLIDEKLQSPELLSLDREVAIMKAIMHREAEGLIEQDEAWLRWMEQMEDLEDGEEPPEQPPMPNMNPETVKMVMALTRNAYEMRFAKRFSIPLTELKQILSQIATIFGQVCDEYQIPNEAKAEFAERMRANVRIAKPMDDEQLARAGGAR